ncbi:hypothetical protein [Sphingomonas colocasiae]|uniref:Uncharacterized protein n=1 Tax=Sphingomonas colocasiae TaxID=1848973 RepID=A0ABS7PKL6_9SPHN|nr:hypothetical protein [Sphingomonas colocasiae]MBY8821840.1 hypothetical protein [Sphingomonas colocasiae]
MLMAALLTFGAEAMAARPTRLPPRDECAAVPSFVAYRAKLVAAIQRRDVAALRKLTAPEVDTSLGGDGGWAEFVEHWGLHQPAKSKLWAELTALLKLGCAMDNGAMSMPYWWGRTPDYDFGTEFMFLPIRDAVPIYFRPRAGSKLVTMTHWDMLFANEFPPNGSRWLRVRTASGKSGFIRYADVRADIDYRAVFALSKGRWQLTSLMAGD